MRWTIFEWRCETGDYGTSVTADGCDRSYFLTFQGSIYGCGSNAFGQICSVEATTYLAAPLRMIGPRAAVQRVACAKNHTYVLLGDGSIKHFGIGQVDAAGLGNGRIVDIAAGGNGLCALTEVSPGPKSVQRTNSMVPKSKLVRPLSEKAIKAVLDRCKATGDFTDAQNQAISLFSNPAALNVLFSGRNLLGQPIGLHYSAVMELYANYLEHPGMQDALHDGTHNAILRIAPVARLLKSPEELQCLSRPSFKPIASYKVSRSITKPIHWPCSYVSAFENGGPENAGGASHGRIAEARDYLAHYWTLGVASQQWAKTDRASVYCWWWGRIGYCQIPKGFAHCA